MRPDLARVVRPWVATCALGAQLVCGATWAHTRADDNSPAAHAPQATISTWTRSNGQSHEVARFRAPTAPDASPVFERVYVVPGSGCTGMAPILPGYFRTLAAREIVVLHKRHVQAQDWPRPAPCRPGFVQSDELPAWTQAWQEFLSWDLHHHPVSPWQVLLLGISEGAELIPALLAEWPETGMAVLLGSTGLDPWEALLLQLAREQDMAFATQLQRQLDASTAEASLLIGGRSLNYWQSLRHWPVAAPLGKSHVPTLVIMGDADPTQAPEGLDRFKSRHHRDWLCTRLVAGADHGLMQKAGRWPGLWPLIQDLATAPTASVFAQRCAQTD